VASAGAILRPNRVERSIGMSLKRRDGAGLRRYLMLQGRKQQNYEHCCRKSLSMLA
jgi:hypothetical protein